MEALLNSNLKAAAPSIFSSSSNGAPKTLPGRIPCKQTPFPASLFGPGKLALSSRSLNRDFVVVRVLEKPTVGISSEISGAEAEPSIRGLELRPTVLVAEKLGEAGLEVLRSVANVDCSYGLTPQELCSKIALCDAIIVRSGTKVTRQVFESSQGRLRVVGRAGVGIDNVDLHAATEHGCLVVNAPTANTVAAAEHGIALLVAMARNVPQATASMKQGKWQRNKYVGVSLVGKTLAVMGFGKVGSEVARRAKGLGMHVIAHDPYAVADRAHAIGVDLVSFDKAISVADFISLHMPLTPTTNKVFNDESFGKMKKGVRIVNVARGGVIDEDALVRALDNGVVAQAALDVFTEEPPAKDNKLVQHEKVIVTPHLGASTVEAQEGVAIEIAEAVAGALKGELSATAVNAPMVPAQASSHYIEEGQWDDGGGSGWTDSTITCITLSHGEAIQVTYSLKGKDTDYVGNPGKANSYYIQEGPWGSLGGGPWTDGTYSTITSIILRHGDIIDAIQVVYSLKGKDTDYVVNPGQHGGSGGDSSQINFEKDEFLTKIEGHLGNYGCFHVIRSLTFTTNKKTYGPYGSQSGNYFTSSGKGKIVGFYGHSGIFLDRLGVYTYLS